MRKFADKQTIKEQSSKQSDGSKTETTLILCGYSRERANMSIFLSKVCSYLQHVFRYTFIAIDYYSSSLFSRCIF